MEKGRAVLVPHERDDSVIVDLNLERILQADWPPSIGRWVMPPMDENHFTQTPSREESLAQRLRHVSRELVWLNAGDDDSSSSRYRSELGTNPVRQGR